METALAVILTVIIITGEGKQNIGHTERMPDLKTCMEEAQKFLEHKFPESVDAQGLFAGCKVPVIKEDHT